MAAEQKSHRPWEMTTSTGKFINLYKVKFELIARDRSKGDYHIIFDDDTEVYLTTAEHKEVLAYIKEDAAQRQREREQEKNTHG